MSKYTTEVRFICESLNDRKESSEFTDVETIIENASPKIFSFYYPIFDEGYRPKLEKKILMHFYTREISEETYGLWKLRLCSRMNEIMPYYNQLYASEQAEFDPFDTHSIKDERVTLYGEVHSDLQNETMVGNHNANTNTSGNSSSWDLYSDTPQGSINGISGAEDNPSLGKNGYLSNARHNTDSTSTNENTAATDDNERNANTSGNIDSTTRVTGNIKGYQNIDPNKRLEEWRKNMLNIDMMIIRELEDLFFQLW